MTPDQRPSEVELRPDEAGAVSLELALARAEVPQLLSLGNEVTHPGLEELDVAVPHMDAHGGDIGIPAGDVE